MLKKKKINILIIVELILSNHVYTHDSYTHKHAFTYTHKHAFTYTHNIT